MKILLLIISVSIYLNAIVKNEINSQNFIYDLNNTNQFIYYKNKSNLIDVLWFEPKGFFFNKQNNMLYIPTSVFRNVRLYEYEGCKDYMYGYEYIMNIYKLYANFFLKIIVLNSKYNGFEGEYFCENKKYLYVDANNINKLDSKINITNNMILDSLKLLITSEYATQNKISFNLKDSSFNTDALKAILNEIPISTKTLTPYNDIAYYLEKAQAYQESIYLLEKIIEKYPNRIVAYINLGDAYLGNKQKDKAIQSYKKYIELMKQAGKENKIPKRVLELVNDSKPLTKPISQNIQKEEKTFFSKLFELLGLTTFRQELNIA